MELWNEYEGRTIDGIFPLARLLRPEGRSAFFSTPNGTGIPTVIRLIESHFDEEEILARWRGVAALNHPNLVKLKKIGKVEMDGTSLVYAVMEPAEANLGEIVSERRLTVVETMQIARSLVAALDALHTNGFVHEHVEPGNVLAVGEAIKLRSDCIREAPEGAEGYELKRRDVHDLAGVLLRALTQQRTLEDAAREGRLPMPFEEIVRKGMSGEWGLEEIAAALTPVAVPQRASRAVNVVAAPVEEAVASADDASAAVASADDAEGASSPLSRLRVAVEDEPEESGMWSGLKIVLGLGVVVLVLIAWHLFHGRPAEQRGAAPAAAVQKNAPAAVQQAAVHAPVAVAAAASAQGESAAADGRVQWRVIAFTYNHEDQAKAKAAAIAQKHPKLGPEVFAPSGHAPYLVSIGGVMSRDQAFALARKARREGLPRDIYAQNYNGRSRSSARE